MRNVSGFVVLLLVAALVLGVAAVDVRAACPQNQCNLPTCFACDDKVAEDTCWVIYGCLGNPGCPAGVGDEWYSLYTIYNCPSQGIHCKGGSGWCDIKSCACQL